MNKPSLSSASSFSVVFNPVELGKSFELPLYQGLEVYYKLYNTEAAANTDKASMQQRQNGDIIPGSSIGSYLLAVSGLNYQKLHQDSRIVLLKPGVDGFSEASVLTLELDTDNELRLFIDEVDLGTVNRQNGQSFNSQPVVGDPDFKSVSGGTGLFLQLYAASYGFNFTSLSSVYSKAEFLALFELQAESD